NRQRPHGLRTGRGSHGARLAASRVKIPQKFSAGTRAARFGRKLAVFVRCGRNMRSYVAAILVVILCTALNWPLSLWLAPTNLAMVYLLGVVAVAARYERGPAMACALLSVLAFDFFFVPPVFTLRMNDTQYVVTGFALLVVGVVISTLAARARAASQAALLAREEQLRNSLLASLSHDLRTPLAVIAGSASSLRDERARPSSVRNDSWRTIACRHVSIRSCRCCTWMAC